VEGARPFLRRRGRGDALHPYRQRPQKEERKTRRQSAARRVHDNIAAPGNRIDDLLAIDEALLRLVEQDAEAAQLFKLRFYAGLSVEEAAEVMGLARATAYRTWSYAKAWLQTRLHEPGGA
jgi:RNA polymerase sigma factor (sigma-70 family)